MSWTKRITKASDVLKAGDEVEAVVLDVRKDQKKISLGLRQTDRNPWEALAEKYPAGTKIKGKVRNMTSYGAFVEIENDIDGMIHISDMSWTRKINNPNEILKPGDEVEAVILDIDPEQQRISLGMKQAETDPWADIEKLYKIGDKVKGSVAKITAFGAFIELSHKIDGLIHISQISKERVERVKDVLKLGDEVEARVIKIDPAERRIGLSIRALDEDFSDAEIKKVADQVSKEIDGAMVGMGEAFDDALSVLEENVKKKNAGKKSEDKETPKSEEKTTDAKDDAGKKPEEKADSAVEAPADTADKADKEETTDSEQEKKPEKATEEKSEG
jgi:small subunit ribosomal protein S1